MYFLVYSPPKRTQVCGGFRRGKESLHDVDMLVSFRRENGEPGHDGFVEVRRRRVPLCFSQRRGGGRGGDQKERNRATEVLRRYGLCTCQLQHQLQHRGGGGVDGKDRTPPGSKG